MRLETIKQKNLSHTSTSAEISLTICGPGLSCVNPEKDGEGKVVKNTLAHVNKIHNKTIYGNG